MATYATIADFGLYVLDNTEVQLPTEEDAVERLLERAERRVDQALGPYPLSFAGELKLDPEALTAAQQAALARATCAAAEHELLVGLDFLAGGDDFLSGDVTVLRQPIRISPRMIEELTGTGLLRRSGCAAPEPSPPIQVA
jgi:hypothetical protein